MNTTQKSKPLRLFFAIDLTEEVSRSLENIVGQLQMKYKKHSMRWSKPRNLHITLQFLEAVKPEDLEILVLNVRSAMKSFKSFDLQLQELELFPTRYRPRIISMNMDQHEILTELAKNIGQGIVTTGYEIETRPFRGHLTLARLNRIERNFILADINLPEIEKIPVREIVLYKSEPTREGSNYTVLERIYLTS